MILKSFELNKIQLNNYKFYLFYGDNQGLKEENINLKKTIKIKFIDMKKKRY